MTDLITLHTHSTFCGHAKDPLDAMVDAASRAGVRVMAATEHYPVNERFDPFKHASMPLERLEPYCQAVLEERDRHPEMEILLGCELDWLGDDEDGNLSAEDFDRFDIVLGSVHFVDGWLINSTRTKERWGEVGIDDVWRRYIDLWCDAAASPMPFTVMSHPDVVKKFGFYPSFDLLPHYERMAEAAREGNRMIEVNTSGKYAPCAQYYPSPEMLEVFARAGVDCTVGTDAHQAAHIARDVREAYDYMRHAGYRRVAVPRIGGDTSYLDL